MMGGIKGDTRSLDHGSHGFHMGVYVRFVGWRHLPGPQKGFRV